MWVTVIALKVCAANPDHVWFKAAYNEEFGVWDGACDVTEASGLTL